MEKTQNRVASTLLQNSSCHKSCISFIILKNHSTSKRATQLGSGRDDRLRDRGNNVNARFVRRQTDRRNSGFSNRCRNNADDKEFYGRRQGRAEGNNSGWLNPNAQQFNPHIETTPVNSDRNDRGQNNEAQTLNN